MTFERIPIIGIIGWKNAGKTTLTTRLVTELVRRGYRVATIKHTHHAFDLDARESDTARHRQAGAATTALVGAERWAVMHDLRGAMEPRLETVVAALGRHDVIIVEGYKRAPIPKIEVRAPGTTDPILFTDDPMIAALAADHEIEDLACPRFARDDIEAIASFIEQRIILPNKAKRV